MTENYVVRQQQSANRDACVGDIEGWPMIIAGVQDDEIDNVTEAGAIGQVTQDSGEQKRTGAEHAIVVSRCSHEVIKDRDRREHCQDHKKPAAKRTALLQLTKCDAGIFSVRKLKKSGDNDALIAEAKRPDGPRLRRLVSHVNAERRQQIACAPREARAKAARFVVNARVHPKP